MAVDDRLARMVSDLLPCPIRGCGGNPWFVQDKAWVECRECGFLARYKDWQLISRPGEQTHDGLPCPGTCLQLASDLEDVRVELAESRKAPKPERRFPVMLGYQERKELSHLVCPTSVPWEFMAQFERTVERNHGQTLEQLAPRGGLGPEEVMAAATNVSIRKWVGKGQEEAVVALKAAVGDWEFAQGVLGRLRAELKEEKRLHQGDHEILAIVTGDSGAYMWRPDQARAWVSMAAERRGEARDADSPVTQFEYTSQWLSSIDLWDDTGIVNRVDWGSAMLKVSNEKGADGWEVCTIIEFGHGTHILLKRVKP